MGPLIRLSCRRLRQVIGNLHRASAFAKAAAGWGIARRKVMGISGKLPDDGEFAAIAQLES
jgi:hypothetical protein